MIELYCHPSTLPRQPLERQSQPRFSKLRAMGKAQLSAYSHIVAMPSAEKLPARGGSDVDELGASFDPPSSENRLEWALFWYAFGLLVIPVIAKAKVTACRWDEWLDRLDESRIRRHWRAHPDHDVGCIVDEWLVVLDADGVESEAALASMEAQHGASPRLINKTRRGSHHFFQLAPGAHVKTSSHDTQKHPERVDIKAARSLVVLPPSPPRTIFQNDAVHRTGLTKVDQAFVDAVFVHNGQPVPRPAPPRPPAEPVDAVELAPIARLLSQIDPDIGYSDWLRAMMAVYHATQGSEDGLALVDRWCSTGRKYQGTREIEAKWRSFKTGTPNPVAIASLIRLAKQGGDDTASAPPPTEIVGEANIPSDDIDRTHPLGRFSLRGQSSRIKREMVEAVPVLGDIALSGQITLIYAAPNTGKTLLTLHLLIESLRK